MKKDCLDIGLVQGFLDCELAHGETARVAAHIASCEGCASMLAAAEDESAIVFPALEREINALVPTQRLWNKINCSIRAERDNRPLWHKAWTFLAVAFANPSIAGAASLLIVVGISTAVWLNKTTAFDTFSSSDTATRVAVDLAIAPAPATPTVSPQIPRIQSAVQPLVRVERVAYRSETRLTASDLTVNTRSTGYLPGEESYVKTISSLNQTVEEQKDGILRPSERISYERDMAVVNYTIVKMKTEVNRNPRNESAKRVLYSSYQNKIDLLSSVAQKEGLVAGLQQ